MKEDRGITIVALIITIILILIITSISITFSMDSVNHSRVVKFVTYMQVIQRKVDLIKEDNEEYTALGKALADSGKMDKIISILDLAKTKGEIQTNYSDEDNNYYRYFDKQSLSNDLGIDNIEDEIVINFRTREVISLNGIEYNKDEYSGTYYTQYLLPTGQKLITKNKDEIRTLNFNMAKAINGLEATITLSDISITNGTLKYKETNGGWIEISNYTVFNKEEVVKITKSGEYTFTLIDNINNEKTISKNISIILTNPPVLKEGMNYQKENYDYIGGINSAYGAVATDGVYLYVWVPRYAYKIESNGYKTIKFIKGTSLITTDNENIGDSEWIIPEEFSNQEGMGYLELTGIWVKESEIEQSIQIEI